MKKTGKALVCAVLAVLLLAVIGAAGALSFAGDRGSSGRFKADAENTGEITVSASGSVRLVPDKASVSFGVTTQEETADLAQSKNSEKVENVIAMLTERGIDEKSIRTTNYYMYPQYDYSEGGGQRIMGYFVCTSMTIQDQDLEDVGKLLSDCVAAGINSIDDVSFLCSGYEEAYSRALAEAVKNARLKAEVLADAAGKMLGDAVSVTEGWQDTSARYSRSANIAYEGVQDMAVKGPSFMPGESEIGANVTVTYRMR